MCTTTSISNMLSYYYHAHHSKVIHTLFCFFNLKKGHQQYGNRKLFQSAMAEWRRKKDDGHVKQLKKKKKCFNLIKLAIYCWFYDRYLKNNGYTTFYGGKYLNQVIKITNIFIKRHLNLFFYLQKVRESRGWWSWACSSWIWPFRWLR